MKLISSKKTKRRIALMFVFAFMLSNLLSLIGPSAMAVVTITAPTAGTCFQHSGTTASGALVTVYNIGAIQFTLTASEINPGQDSSAGGGGTASTGQAVATTTGQISTATNVTGNVFSLVPPTGTNFVIVPGFQDTATGTSNHLLAANTTISNAVSQDSTGGTVDNPLGISVGVITAGTAGIGRAIVAIARDADSTATGTANAGSETYPKSGTGNNTVTISITGLGIAIPPSGDGALSGTLQATIDSNPPSGVGTSAGLVSGAAGATVAAAIPGISGTINLCTVTSAAGQVEAALDADDDATELYDKSGTSSANILALGQISSNTKVWATDTATSAAPSGTSAGTSLVDIEPILIRGTTGTGTATRDQVIATAELLNSVTSTGLTPSAGAIDTTTYFGNSVVAPITISFSDDNASATTALQAVDIIIENSTTSSGAGSAAGLANAQTSRHGFLGALRALVNDGAGTQTNSVYNSGSGWGVASVAGGPIGSLLVQEGVLAAGTNNLGGLGAITANAAEPQHALFVDLRLECASSTNPVAGWFAVLNCVATNTGTTDGTQQIIRATQGSDKFVVNSATTLFKQGLTNIGGSNPTSATSSRLGYSAAAAAAGDATTTAGNALLYASCTNNVLTLIPIQNGFDAQRDFIAVIPRLQVTTISSTFASDVNLVAQVSGNNLTGSTTINLAKLVGVPATGGNSILASAQGVGVAANSNLAVNCSSGSTSSVVLSGVNSGTVATAVTAACTSGAIASPSTFFTGGAPNSVSGTTVVDGSPTVQGEARGILVSESNVTGFNELVSQVGGGTQGTVFEIQLPSACDVIDDRDDNNTAVSATAAAGGNDATRITLTSTAGVTAAISAGGSGDAALTNANVVEPVSGSNPAKIRFRISAVGGATDNATTDAILVRLDSQDIFCPTTATGDLTAKVVAANKINSPTLTSSLGSISIGTAKQALTVSFADDVATSTKGETSTNTMIGATPRLSGGGVTTGHPIKIVENDARSIPIGGTVAARNLDPDNSVLSSVITRGQLWLVPSNGTAFSAAPAAADVSFSDNSLVVDGAPLLVTTSTIDPNAPLGTILIGVKKGAGDPATSTSTITVKNLKLASASSSTTDLISSVEFFSQDAGVVINTPGAASGNSASTPTVFTPFSQGSTKGSTQINAATTSVVQLGSGSLANQLLTSRLTTQGTPQLNPFAKVIAAGTQKSVDATKVTVSSGAVATAAASSSGAAAATSTDNVITVTGAAGAVDGGAEVVITTGTSTFDSVTVVAADDGSFVAKVRGDCASPGSVTVNVTEQVSATKTTSVTKTALCQGSTGPTEDSVFTEIAGSDGSATVAEVLSYVSSNGGLAAIVSAGGGKLAGVIKAAKAALGLS